MKRNLKILIYSAAAGIILLLILLPKFSSSGNAQANSPSQRNAPLQVSAVVAKYEELSDKILTTGSILANEEVELQSEVSGKITNILFNEGTRVNRGDLLVKINDAELQAQLSRAELKLQLLKDKEYRAKTLLEKQAISKEEYDIALNELNSQEADIEFIKAQIAKTELRAPFHGTIGLKNVSEGSFLSNQTIIATLQNLNPVKIDFSVPEKYAGSVKVGNTISFTLEGIQDTFTGKIYAVEPKIDPLTRTLRIRALSPNQDTKIFPGAFANIRITLSEIENAFLIPSHAIVPELNAQKVYLYRNGQAVPQEIEIGIRTDQHVQVTNGISRGDTVITSGILQIRPGINVVISEFK
jgi:membrane fusion protein, multidrug efflux system